MKYKGDRSQQSEAALLYGIVKNLTQNTTFKQKHGKKVRQLLRECPC